MTEVRIETASERDVEDFVEVAEDRGFLLARLRRRGRRRGQVFIAFEGVRPVGYVYLRLEAAEEFKLRWFLRRAPLLERLRVVSDRRKQGIGRKLVQAAEASALRHRRGRIALGVTEPEVVNFYLRLGYAEWRYGLVRTYRDGGQTEYCRVFVKRLPR